MRKRSAALPARVAAAFAGLAAGLVKRIWSRARRRPLDSLAILGAGVASIVIVVNAMFLQSGSHPAPFFANPSAAAASPAFDSAVKKTAAANVIDTPAAVPLPPSTPTAARGPQAVSTRHGDAIGELIGSSTTHAARVQALQRALSAFGYGQIRPTGVLDAPTVAAVQMFEREHKLPVSGHISERLLAEISAMTSRQ